MKKCLFSLFLLGFLIGHVSSQNEIIDSLKLDVNININDTVKLKSLRRISNIFLKSNLDSSIFYAHSMLAMAQDKKMLYFVSDAYDLISNVYEQEGDLEKCVISIDSAKHYADLINDPVGVMYFATNQGSNYMKMGRYFDALQSFEEVRSIGERIVRPSRVAAALNNIGAVYHYLGDDETSLDFFIQSYELRLENNLTKKLAYSLNNIGAIYSKYGNFNEALEYHEKALQTAITENDDYNYLVALINLGLDYDFLNNFDRSLEYYSKALIEAKKQEDKTSQAHVLERLSSIYIEKENYEKATLLLQKALEISVSTGNNYDIASFSNSLGIIYLKEKKHKKAFVLFNDALSISKEINASKIKVDTYKSLMTYYYSINNSDEAFRYQNLYDNNRDSIYTAETNLKIANLKNRFELDLKLDEIKLKDIELSSTKKESSDRLLIIYFALISGVLLFFLVLYILFLYQKIKRKNYIIHQSEEKVLQLLKQEKELGKLKTQLISTVSHEFRTPMAIISSNAQLLRDFNDTMDDEMRKETLKYITNGVENMISMMCNFEALDKNTILEFNPEKLNIKELLLTIANGLQSLQKYNNRIKIRNELTVNNVIMDQGLITHIVRNLLVNALKFSADKHIELSLNNNMNNIIIVVADKGIGMSKQDVTMIFDNFHRGSNVENIKGTGIGMSVVKRCVDLHNGIIKIDSKFGFGTRIAVTLPFKIYKDNQLN